MSMTSSRRRRSVSKTTIAAAAAAVVVLLLLQPHCRPRAQRVQAFSLVALRSLSPRHRIGPSSRSTRVAGSSSFTLLRASTLPPPSPSSIDKKDSGTGDDVPDVDRQQQQEEQEQFDWYGAWYPLVPVEILDDSRPHKFQLLGQDVVVWKDSRLEQDENSHSKPSRPRRGGAKQRVGGTWRAFKDECPHRKVPLSEGRVERDGSLMCSYHGWKFDGQGQLLDVPQVRNEKNQQQGQNQQGLQLHPHSHS